MGGDRVVSIFKLIFKLIFELRSVGGLVRTKFEANLNFEKVDAGKRKSISF